MGTFTKPDDNVAQLQLSGTEHVAVFGAGAGGHTFAIARAQGGNGKVFAVDVRADLLERVKRDAALNGLGGINTVVGDYSTVGGTRLPANSLDVVVLPNTLFMAPDKEGVMEEAYRVLKPGGRLLVVDWKDSYGGMGPQPQHVVGSDKAEKLAKQTGFHKIKEFSAGAQHYGLIFGK